MTFVDLTVTKDNPGGSSLRRDQPRERSLPPLSRHSTTYKTTLPPAGRGHAAGTIMHGGVHYCAVHGMQRTGSVPPETISTDQAFPPPPPHLSQQHDDVDDLPLPPPPEDLRGRSEIEVRI